MSAPRIQFNERVTIDVMTDSISDLGDAEQIVLVSLDRWANLRSVEERDRYTAVGDETMAEIELLIRWDAALWSFVNDMKNRLTVDGRLCEIIRAEKLPSAAMARFIRIRAKYREREGASGVEVVTHLGAPVTVGGDYVTYTAA